jgi:hypothetical protein
MKLQLIQPDGVYYYKVARDSVQLLNSISTTSMLASGAVDEKQTRILLLSVHGCEA